MIDEEWSKNLKVGDEVAICFNAFGTKTFSITRVARVTPSGRIVVQYQNTVFGPGGIIYGKYEQGPRTQLVPVTPAVHEAIARERVLSFIHHTKFKDLDTGTLTQIAELIKAGAGGK